MAKCSNRSLDHQEFYERDNSFTNSHNFVRVSKSMDVSVQKKSLKKDQNFVITKGKLKNYFQNFYIIYSIQKAIMCENITYYMCHIIVAYLVLEFIYNNPPQVPGLYQ